MICEKQKNGYSDGEGKSERVPSLKRVGFMVSAMLDNAAVKKFRPTITLTGRRD